MHKDQTLSKKLLEEIQRPFNEKATTITWLNRQTREVAEQRLWDIMEHNGKAALKLIKYVGSLPDELRMVRLGSNQLPAYTQHEWSYFWRKPDVRQRAERLYGAVGQASRELDVRVSMHPGQFTVLASVDEDIVNRSIEEFEYHVDIAKWMGYGKKFQDFKINVHISGKKGPTGIKECLPRLSPEARNTITIENDENSWGLEASLELSGHCGLVLDIHHHWVNSGGEYIKPSDDRVKQVIDSWRGVRPTMHYSISREDYLPDHSPNTRPDYQQLLATGHKKAKLRAHSDMMWNTACNDWALRFWDDFDIMVEAKHKNLANQQLHKQFTKKILNFCHK